MSSNTEQAVTPDVEKGVNALNTPESPVVPLERKATHDAALEIGEAVPVNNRFLRATQRVEKALSLEARGIHRVKSIEQSPKTTLSFLQIVVLWLSINTAAQNITLASIGQEAFGLGFVDSALCSVLGGFLGCIPVAYTATWGPWSGNRTMVSELFT